jgi:hypothetical protein
MRRLVTALLATAIAACGFDGNPRSSGDDGAPMDGAGPTPDANPDAIPGDAPPECLSWDPHYFDACLVPAADDDWTINNGTHVYDSAADTYDGADVATVIGAGHSPVIDIAGAPVRVLVVKDFTINNPATLQIVGDKPVVIAAWGNITASGELDASSVRGGRTGAGANPAACATGGATPGQIAVASGGSGGGAGGAFGGNGGPGGRGDDNTRAGGSGGTALASAPAGIRGGCPGSASGAAGPSVEVGPPDETVSSGGAGGGAVLLTARGNVTVTNTGVVRAGGAGGAGSPNDTACGGGGGGSGGFVGLEAGGNLTMDGDILANGGGGGSSATYTAGGAAGNPGDDAHPADDGAAAGGGATTCGPPGGVGSGANVLAGIAGGEGLGCGGGGGGGGAGFIMVRAGGNVAGNGTRSPATTAIQ